MSNKRIDTWTDQDDTYLAETVLKYVRHGKTQIQAFEDIAEELDRSAAACGFRWNAVVRHNYVNALRLARRERRRQKLDMPVKKAPNEVVEVKRNTNVDEVTVKEYKDIRVLTFKDIDEVHGRAEGTASRNFLKHKDRLIENEDYFIVKNLNNEFRGLEKIPNRGLTVLTESGYLMLVKSFTDDLAWEVQRSLLKSYFRVKQIATEPIHSYMIADPVERAKAWIREQEGKQKIEADKLMLEQTVAEFAPRISYLDTILDSKDSLIVSQIAADYGLSAKALNKILHEEDVQYKRNEQWLLYGPYKGLGYTESRTIPFTKPNGEDGSSLQTRWTQKGRMFIHSILEKRNIKATMDLEIEKPNVGKR